MKTKTETKTETEIETKPKAKRTKKAPLKLVINVDERESQYRTLRLMVNNYYDYDRLRLAFEQRYKPKKGGTILLTIADKEQLRVQTEPLVNFMKGISADIKGLLRQMPFYRDYLKDFEGVGEIGAAIILSQFDIKKADTVSKMWAFTGLVPLPCRRCKTCHNVVEQDSEGDEYKHAAYASFRNAKQDVEEKAKTCPLKTMTESDTYESGKAQKPVKGEKLPYNAWLRSKVVGAIGSAQITNNTKWRKIYDDYKHRKLTQGWGVSDGHRHNAAVRYMMKMMILEIWKAWRAYEGLPVRPSYHEEKQGGHGFNGR